MVIKKKIITDVLILVICHVVGFVLISVYAMFAHELAKAIPNVIGKLLFPTNFSLWEQGKMLIVPVCIVFIAEYFIVGRKLKNFVPAHFIIAFALPTLMLGTYYVYGLFLGSLSIEGPQIMLSVALLVSAFVASIFLVTSKKDMTKYYLPFALLYLALVASYVVFTFMPPKVGIFYDPINQIYGSLY